MRLRESRTKRNRTPLTVLVLFHPTTSYSALSGIPLWCILDPREFVLTFEISNRRTILVGYEQLNGTSIRTYLNSVTFGSSTALIVSVSPYPGQKSTVLLCFPRVSHLLWLNINSESLSFSLPSAFCCSSRFYSMLYDSRGCFPIKSVPFQLRGISERPLRSEINIV